MSIEFEKNLEKYAKVILKIGLTFQPKQRIKHWLWEINQTFIKYLKLFKLFKISSN